MLFEDSELDEFSLRRGDVLICEGGYPGRAAVWDERESNIYFQKAIHRVRFKIGINPSYFVYVLRESADSGRLRFLFHRGRHTALYGEGVNVISGAAAAYSRTTPHRRQSRRTHGSVRRSHGAAYRRSDYPNPPRRRHCRTGGRDMNLALRKTRSSSTKPHVATDIRFGRHRSCFKW